MNAVAIEQELKKHANPQRAAVSRRFFKTGSGEYGEGDEFLGITVPQQRVVALLHLDVPLKEISRLLKSRIHEHRFTALEILVAKYEQSKVEKEKAKIVGFYLKHRLCINNWDLVDTSVEYILGDFLWKKDKSVLYDLARSKSVWERRMGIIATFAFIKRNTYTDTVRIATILLHDTHDLIHKAVGWMLREVGKRDESVLLAFLDKYCIVMPRTMLRYAIERLPKRTQRYYLRNKQ